MFTYITLCNDQLVRYYQSSNHLVPYFKDPEKSILKTVIMSLTGELEFENVEFGEEQPIYGKLVYLLWVFFIMLVLVNLLNGLLLKNIIIKKV